MVVNEPTVFSDENFTNEFDGLEMKEAIEKICAPEYMIEINRRASTLVDAWLENQSVPEQDLPAITERYMQGTRMVLSQVGFLRMFQVAQKHTTRRYEEEADPEVQHLITECSNLLTTYFEDFSQEEDLEKQRRFKSDFLKLKCLIAVKVLEGMRASPDHTQLHIGVMQSATTFELPVLFNRPFSGYARERPGPIGQLMASQLIRMLPKEESDSYAHTHVGVFGSGMSGFKAVREGLGGGNATDLVIAKTVYFEIPMEYIDKDGNIPQLTSPDKLEKELGKRAQQNTNKPLVVYLQRTSSNPNCTSDVKFGAAEAIGTLEGLQNIGRPIILIEDTTMDPLNGFKDLNTLWPRINRLVSQGTDITVLNIASLIKHGQYGLDAVNGGIGTGIGSRPEILDRYAAGVGANMSEYSAAMLFPLDFISMTERVSHAREITQQMYQVLVANTANSLLEVDASIDSETQLLYLRAKNGVPSRLAAQVINGAITASLDPSLRIGTSYGFDNIRYSVLDGQYTMFRLTPGQLTLTELDKQMNGVLEILTSEQSYEKLKMELSAIISLVDVALPRVQFDPLPDSYGNILTEADRYIRDAYGNMAVFADYTTVLSFYPLLSMIHNGTLKVGDQTISFSAIDQERLARIKQELPDKGVLEMQFFKFALNLPEVISEIQRKIPALGRLSPKATRGLCNAVIFADRVTKTKWYLGRKLYEIMSGYYQHI